jgi:hypothetical protein
MDARFAPTRAVNGSHHRFLEVRNGRIVRQRPARMKFKLCVHAWPKEFIVEIRDAGTAKSSLAGTARVD